MMAGRRNTDHATEECKVLLVCVFETSAHLPRNESTNFPGVRLTWKQSVDSSLLKDIEVEVM